MTRPDHDEISRAEPGVADLPTGQAGGLTCPRCGCRHFLVVETRHAAGGIRRRRECRNCGWWVWTREEITPPRAELED